MSSISDVAKLAGVSTATVSRVLNDTGLCSPRTQQKVIAAVKELNYQPNILARSLAKASSDNVGLMVNSYRGNFFAALVSQLQESFENQNKFLLTCRASSSRESELQAISRLQSMRCAALVLHSRALTDEDLLRLAEDKVHFALIDRFVPGLEDRCVTFKHRKSGRLAVEHLYKKGHRKIACLSSTMERHSARERYAGYAETVEEFELEDIHIGYGHYDRDGGYKAAEKLFSRRSDVTAIFTCSEQMCVGAYEYFHHAGLRVPDDLSIVSVDSVDVCQILSPKVTTVTFPIEDMAIEAQELVCRMMGGKPAIRPAIFTPNIKIFHSVKSL